MKYELLVSDSSKTFIKEYLGENLTVEQIEDKKQLIETATRQVLNVVGITIEEPLTASVITWGEKV